MLHEELTNKYFKMQVSGNTYVFWKTQMLIKVLIINVI